MPLGVQCALTAELKACMHAVSATMDNAWTHLWIETYSIMVTKAFCNYNIVPWRLRVEWLDCMLTCSKIHVYVSHIYREGNQCADKLANYAVDHEEYKWWSEAPNFIHPCLFIDGVGAYL